MFDFISKSFSSIFTRITGQDKLTESNMESSLVKVKEVLVQADVPFDVAQKFIDQVKADTLGKKIFASLKPSEMLLKIVHDRLIEFLGGKQSEENFMFKSSSTIMMLGLQGSGKTTTTAKLAYYIRSLNGKARKILLTSVDFYRPAAIDQLEILSKQVGVDFYRSSFSNVIAAAQDIMSYANKNKYEYLFVDTAGRLHVDDDMLKELKSLDEIFKSKYKILVLDCMTGQESLKVAQSFDKIIGFTGSILTKLDSNSRAGAAFAFKYVIGKPIMFMATGEKLADLEAFRPERIANRIIGMGDVLTLVEKAQHKIKKNEQADLENAFNKGKMTLCDFAKQLEMINKLGSLSSIAGYLPNIGGLGSISSEMLQNGELEIKKFKAIINSMTMKERVFPSILDASRKKRVAKGSGVSVADVNALLNRFEQGQKLLKMFKSRGFK